MEGCDGPGCDGVFFIAAHILLWFGAVTKTPALEPLLMKKLGTTFSVEVQMRGDLGELSTVGFYEEAVRQGTGKGFVRPWLESPTC